MRAHDFQRNACGRARKPILNAACKEDPARLGESFGAVNLDVWDFDEQTKTDLKTLPNFVQGDVCNMTFAEDESFQTIVLGEFLEHCIPAAAIEAMKECRRVLANDGELILTFPLDDRPASVQHGVHLLKSFVEGETGTDITVWHQTVWTDEMLDDLFTKSGGWEVIHKEELHYSFVKKSNDRASGWGMILRKA